ncbi:Ionotropic receptor 582 [Blattella germanica]|nr:Ionotropic receptor 582 [Blattella germanica]
MEYVKVIISLVLFLTIASSHLNRHFHIARCILNISERYFPADHTLAISWPKDFRTVTKTKKLKTHSPPVEEIFFEWISQWPVSIYSTFKTVTWVGERFFYGGFIVFAYFENNNNQTDAVDVFWNQILQLYAGHSWNARAPLIVALMNTFENSPAVAKKFVRVLKRFNIKNSLVIVTDKETKTLDLYTWFPRKCTSFKMNILDAWVMDNDGYFVLNADLFPQKTSRNFHRCPLRVYTLSVKPSVGDPVYTYSNKSGQWKIEYEDGWEIQLLQIIAWKLNMTQKYLEPFWSSEPDGGLFTSLDTDNADVAFAASITRHMSFFETTKGYLWDTTRWYVPCGKKHPQWDSISRIFHWVVWLFWFICILLAGFVFSFLSHKTIDSKVYKSVVGSVSNACSITLGISVSQKPKSLQMRWFFFSWVCYSLAFDTVFQTYLTTFLIDSGIIPYIRNMEELIESDMTLGISENHVKLFNNTEDQSGRRIIERRIDCTFNSTCYLWAVQNQNLSILATEMWFNDISSTFESSDIHRRSLCTIEGGDFESVYIVMMLQRGSIYLDYFNHVIQGVVEAGIFMQWTEMTYYEQKLQNTTQVDGTSTNAYSQLTMDMMQSVFLVLFMGQVLSLFALIGECLFRKMTTSKKQRRFLHIVN